MVTHLNVFYNYKCYKANIYYVLKLIFSDSSRCQKLQCTTATSTTNLIVVLVQCWFHWSHRCTSDCNICSVTATERLTIVDCYNEMIKQSHMTNTTIPSWATQFDFRQTSDSNTAIYIWTWSSDRHALKSDLKILVVTFHQYVWWLFTGRVFTL